MARRFLSVFCPGFAPDRLTQLVVWCDRYSPLAAADGPDGIIADITGCTHLSGGEGPLLVDLQKRLHRLKIQSKAAIAGSWGMAWALARYGSRFIVSEDQSGVAAGPLPVEALRLPVETVRELRRLGLTTIASIRKLPRSSLAARFGEPLLLRLDQVFNQAGEPLTPWRPPPPYRIARALAEPVLTVSAVEYVLHEALGGICSRLEKDHQGARHIELTGYRVDGTVDACSVRTSKPTRSVSHLLRLFHEPVHKLRAGFGFDAFALSVLDYEALEPRQRNFLDEGAEEDEAAFDDLVDRFGMKFGLQDVARIRICESFQPESAVEFLSVAAPKRANASWPDYRVRPVQLIDPPLHIQVSILIPGASPVQIFLGQRKYRVVRSEGPERLTGEWWREKEWQTRDYYRIEDERGFRFWIFRDSTSQWFLHGCFP